MSGIILNASDLSSNSEISDGKVDGTVITEIATPNPTSSTEIDEIDTSTILDNRNNDWDDCSNSKNSSSVIDSDSEIEEVINVNSNKQHSEITLTNETVDPTNFCQSNNEVRSNIGNIVIENSSDVTFGNKTFFHGPVTIKQFIYEEEKLKRKEREKNEIPKDLNNSNDNISKNREGKAMQVFGN